MTEIYLKQAKDYFIDGEESFYDDILNMKDSGKLVNIITSTDKLIKEKIRWLKTAQIRKIYASIKKTKEGSLNELQLLRPKLAYIAARQTEPKARDGANIIGALLNDLIAKVDNVDKLNNLKSFMESAIAYHKYHEKFKQKNNESNRKGKNNRRNKY